MRELLRDPFLYLNWGVAALGIYLIKKYGPELEKSVDHPVSFFLKFSLLSIAVGGCMYLTIKFGDISLMKLGMTP